MRTLEIKPLLSMSQDGYALCSIIISIENRQTSSISLWSSDPGFLGYEKKPSVAVSSSIARTKPPVSKDASLFTLLLQGCSSACTNCLHHMATSSELCQVRTQPHSHFKKNIENSRRKSHPLDLRQKEFDCLLKNIFLVWLMAVRENQRSQPVCVFASEGRSLLNFPVEGNEASLMRLQT